MAAAAQNFPIAGVYSEDAVINALAAALELVSDIEINQIKAILRGNILANTIDPPKDMVPGGHFGGIDLSRLYEVIGNTVHLIGTQVALAGFINTVIGVPGGRSFRPVNRDQTHYIQEYLANTDNKSIFPQANDSTTPYTHKLDVPRVTGTTGYNPRLTNLYVSYDNSTKDIVANPRYIATLGTLGDPSTRDWKDMLFLMPGTPGKMDIPDHQYTTLPMRYVAQAGLAHIITEPPSITYSAAGWVIRIMTTKGLIEGNFDPFANPLNDFFKGNNEKNAAIREMLDGVPPFNLNECTKYLLIKIIGDLFQVMCILYLFHEESRKSKTQTGFTLKYHEGNTVVTTSDIIVLYRCWLNNVPVIHTDQKGKSTLWMPNIQTPESLVNITKDMIDCIVTRIIGNNMSVINTFQAVIDSAPINNAADPLSTAAVTAAVTGGKTMGIFRPKREPRAKSTTTEWLESTWGQDQLSNGVTYLNEMMKLLIEQNKKIMDKFSTEKSKVISGQPVTHVNALTQVKILAAESNFLNPFSKKDSQHYKRNSGISFILPNKKIKFGLSSTMRSLDQVVGEARMTMVGGVNHKILASMHVMANNTYVPPAIGRVNPVAAADDVDDVDDVDAADAAVAAVPAARAADADVATRLAENRDRVRRRVAAERVDAERVDAELVAAPAAALAAAAPVAVAIPDNLRKAVLAAIQNAEHDDRDHIKYADDTMPMEWLINVEYYGGIRNASIPYIPPRSNEIRMIQQPFIDRAGDTEVNDAGLPPNPDTPVLDDPFNADASSERLFERARSEPPNCHLITQYLIAVAKESIRLLIEDIISDLTYSTVDIGDLAVPGTAVVDVQKHARIAIQDAITRLGASVNAVDFTECLHAANGTVDTNVSSIITKEFERINNKNGTADLIIRYETYTRKAARTERARAVAETAAETAEAETAEARAAERAARAEERARAEARAAERAAETAAREDALKDHIGKCYPQPPHVHNVGAGSPGLLNPGLKSAFSFVYVRQFHPEVFTLANCMAIGLGFDKKVGSGRYKMEITDFENLPNQDFYDDSRNYSLRNDSPYMDISINRPVNNEDRPYPIIDPEYRDNLRKSTSVAVKYTKYIIQAYPHLGTSSLKTFLNLFRKAPYLSVIRGVKIHKKTLGAAAEMEDTRAALVAQGMPAPAAVARAAPAVGSSSALVSVSRLPPRNPVLIYSSAAAHSGVDSVHADSDEKHSGGGNDDILSDEELHERLPQAVEIAIHIYEIIYALTMKASLLDKNIYELVEDLKEYISYYDEGIKEMEGIPDGSIDEEKREEMLNVLKYERSVIENVLVPRFEKHNSKSVHATTPVAKVNESSSETIIPPTKTIINFNTGFNKTKRANGSKGLNISNGSNKFRRTLLKNNLNNNSNIPVPVVATAPAAAAAGGRFKKTRKNRKLKKLKQSYKKTRSALRKSRKH